MEFAQTLDIRNSRGFQAGWQIKCKTLNLIRYADDKVILHKAIIVVLQAKTIIQEWLSQVGLELKPEKTRIAHTLKEYQDLRNGTSYSGNLLRKFTAFKSSAVLTSWQWRCRSCIFSYGFFLVLVLILPGFTIPVLWFWPVTLL